MSLRKRLSLTALPLAAAVMAFAPAEQVDAGDDVPRDLTLRAGDALPKDAMIVDFALLEERETVVEEVPAAVLAPVTASYYGARFAGRRTANGERFDPAQMTAAHRTLPFGTMVEVTNVRNGKTVTVRINDRGPFHGNRAIDLSRGAADQIGMVSSGTAKVTIRAID